MAGMQGTAAAGEPGARRAAAVEASGHAWRGKNMKCVFRPTPPLFL